MEEVRDNFWLLEAKTHVVTAVRCMLPAVAKSICSKYFINTSTAFDACTCETRIGSPVAFVVQRLCFSPRLLPPSPAHALATVCLGCPFNNLNPLMTRAGFPEVGETGERSHQQRQWQYLSGRHVVLLGW